MTLNEFWRHVEMRSKETKVTFDMYRVLVHISLHCHKEKAGNYSTYVSVGRLTESLGWKSLSRVERQLDKLEAAGLIKRGPVPHNKCGTIDGTVLVEPAQAETVTSRPDVKTAAEADKEKRQAEADAGTAEAEDPWWNDLKYLAWTRAEVELFKQAGAHLPPWQAIRQVRSCGRHYGTAENVAETLRGLKPEVGDPPMRNEEPMRSSTAGIATDSTSRAAGGNGPPGFGRPKHAKPAANQHPSHAA
jgi:hypothetical protein